MNRLQNSFALPQQKESPESIRSIQLHREGSPSSPPLIRLNLNEQLVLSFDQLKNSSNRFLLRVVHYSKQWEQESPIPPDFYMGGFFDTYFSEGRKSLSRRPTYWHYEYKFPNSQLNFKTSGNYLLSVYDADSRNLLFSVPFFVSENAGDLTTRIEQLHTRQDELRQRDQLFSTYQFPKFVEMPQFDLSLVYIQNQFWGRSRLADIFDTVTPGTVHFHVSRDNTFISDYNFFLLNLPSVSTSNYQIIETQSGEIPPKVILRRDIQHLNTLTGRAPGSRFGVPAGERNAEYAEVQFRFEADSNIPSYRDLFLVGDFNQWMVREQNRMHYSTEESLWKGKAIVKEGTYAYKYVIVDQNKIDDTALDQPLSSRPEEYLTFIYFRDPVRQYDRLLKVHQFR